MFGVATGMSEQSNCRHEFVKIFQRKLKGLERRLVSTRVYLPLGFKTPDLGHLGEGAYCFCSKCRARVYPRRTNAERLAARQKILPDKKEPIKNELLVEVEELELESVDLNDIASEGVTLNTDEGAFREGIGEDI